MVKFGKPLLFIFVLILLFIPTTSVISSDTPSATAPGAVASEAVIEEEYDLMWIAWVGSIVALLFSLILAVLILRKDEGTQKMKEISQAVHEGAIAYIKQQYKVVSIFFVLIFILLSIISYVFKLLSPFVPFAFLKRDHE